MERRSHQRRQVVRNGLLYHPQGYSYPCRIVNASSGGLFVKTADARIYKGNYVEVAISASPNMAEPITVKALVVHQKSGGIGLLCENDIPLHELFDNRQ
jgi:hypothetical protein